jgi:regulator of protease activity HflC (stomatin/prohibitin superfamily)
MAAGRAGAEKAPGGKSMQASVDVSQPGVPARSINERPYPSWPGPPFLVGAVVAFIAAVVLVSRHNAGSAKWVGIALFVVGAVCAAGLTTVTPGQARVVQLFGEYRGTVRTEGLRWVNPLAVRRKVSVRVRNKETPTVKVNDSDGNPIEFAAVVVWQVRDTARATYGVEDFVAFVNTQSESALRHVANTHPYDNAGFETLSLRDHTDEVAQELASEIGARVVPAGVDILEARITRLSYAPEIAQVMLQRQQANAVVAARSRIVEGAVSMVEMALKRLAENDVVELDEERKAAMVSNLMVVLCGDRGTQPIVNAGSLYQ